MLIKYTNFSEGIHEFDFQVPVDKIGLSDEFFGIGSLFCRMDKSIHQIVLNCNLVLDARFSCDRCMTEYETKIESNFTLTYLFSREKSETDELDLKFLSPDNDKIDLTPDVIEFANIEIPMKKLCNTECKGLCSNCGINLNEDKCDCIIKVENDIWEPLKKLKDNFNN
jgi:uncharacterized protein